MRGCWINVRTVETTDGFTIHADDFKQLGLIHDKPYARRVKDRSSQIFVPLSDFTVAAAIAAAAQGCLIEDAAKGGDA